MNTIQPQRGAARSIQGEIAPVKPAKPAVTKAIIETFSRLPAASVLSKPVPGILMGRLVSIASVPSPLGFPKNKPVSVFVRGNNDLSLPADPNTAKVFYVAVGTGRATKNYGPFPFKNPLAP